MNKLFDKIVNVTRWIIAQPLGRYGLTFVAGMVLILLVQCSVARAGEVMIGYDIRFNDWTVDVCNSGTCIGYDFANDMGCLSRNQLSDNLRLGGGLCYQYNTESLVGRVTGAISDNESTGEVWARALVFEDYVEGAYGVGFRYIEDDPIPVPATEPVGPNPNKPHHEDHRKHHHED